MKPIKNFEHYLIDENGNIFSSYSNRFLSRNNCKSSPYELICLSKNKKEYTRSIHRLIAETFILNPKNKSSVNHKDGNKKNNTILNLEWFTQKENIRHSIDVLKNKPKPNQLSKIGSKNSNSKKVIQRDKNNCFIKQWDCYRDVTRKLGIVQSGISRACDNIQLSAGGFRWTSK